MSISFDVEEGPIQRVSFWDLPGSLFATDPTAMWLMLLWEENWSGEQPNAIPELLMFRWSEWRGSCLV